MLIDFFNHFVFLLIDDWMDGGETWVGHLAHFTNNMRHNIAWDLFILGQIYKKNY